MPQEYVWAVVEVGIFASMTGVYRTRPFFNRRMVGVTVFDSVM